MMEGKDVALNCPLKVGTISPHFGSCDKEECAWWVADGENWGCAAYWMGKRLMTVETAREDTDGA